MAVFHATIKAQTVLTELPVTLVLPEGEASRPRRVLYLLHDLGEGRDRWLYRCRLQELCERWGMAALLPELGRSLYCDMVYGRGWFTYLCEELPALARRALPVSGDPRDHCAAGCGLGGYGAAKCLLRAPSRFGGAVALNAPLLLGEALPALLRRGKVSEGELTGHFGRAGTPGEREELLPLAAALPADAALRLYQWEDGDWREQNRRAARALVAAPLRHRYAQASPGREESLGDALGEGLAFVFGEGGEEA